MEDRGPQVLAVAVFFFALTWLAVGLRVYVRAILIKSWGTDDWAMALALAMFTCYLCCQIGGVHYGTGRHNADLSQHDMETALHFWYYCEIFYVVSSTCLKVAVGLFLLRIAVRKPHVWMLHAFNGASVVFGAAYCLICILQCNPISTYWTLQPNNVHCLPADTVANLTYAASALGSVADWVFGTLPAFIIWDLHMNPRTKLVVCGILGFAAIGSTATLVRLPYIKGMVSHSDFLWTTVDMAIWSTIEPGIGITAACIATLRPLLQHFFHHSGLSTAERTNTNNFGGTKSRVGYIRSPDSYGMGLPSQTTAAFGISKSVQVSHITEEVVQNSGSADSTPKASHEVGR
ncbi:hypothetical protein K490DRAFT_76255 [Saccharata proteae CBS 121410]|uniref:Rhodopsin domain-containing protein n=1 Tax=Saccharata proteae CBS 121410 TaxID=1314787 RepID=A0A9P4LRS8_9PEZI|nr:hypothetical protein K490DRAFT_76255 [Saccharata proteae CBS 121410]